MNHNFSIVEHEGCVYLFSEAQQLAALFERETAEWMRDDLNAMPLPEALQAFARLNSAPFYRAPDDEEISKTV